MKRHENIPDDYTLTGYHKGFLPSSKKKETSKDRSDKKFRLDLLSSYGDLKGELAKKT